MLRIEFLGVFKSRMKSGVTLALAATVLALSSAPASGGGKSLAMLDSLDRGNWELRYRDSSGSPQKICLDSGAKLIQLRHPAMKCDRVIVKDSPTAVTVQYTCRGNGYGRTEIRRESSRLVQINSQGIAGGLPFSFAAEARRVGDCGQ